jgi:hypothetical protein
MTSGIRTETIFDLQGAKDAPEAVYDEVMALWERYGLDNDNAYYKWNDEWDGEAWPNIASYLSNFDIKTCLIHWWW